MTIPGKSRPYGLTSMAIICFLSVALPRLVKAQLKTLESGDRVQIVVVSGERLESIVGRLRYATKDSVYLKIREGQNGLARISRSDVRDVYVSDGTFRRTGRGALVGLAVGGLTGIGLGAVVDPCQPSGETILECFMSPTTRGGTIIFGAIAGGLTGLLGGAIVGNNVSREHWGPGELPDSDDSLWSKPAGLTGMARPSIDVSLVSRQHWSLRMGLGTPVNVSEDLRAALSSSGFGDSIGCWIFCDGDVRYPITHHTATGFQLAAYRSAGRWVDAGMRYSRARLDKTVGYDAQSGSRVEISPEVSITEVLWRVQGGSRFHLVFGAGMYSMTIAGRDRGYGTALEAGVELMRWKNAFFFVEARIRRVARMHVKIFDPDNLRGSLHPDIWDDREIDLSSRSSAVGIGLHL